MPSPALRMARRSLDEVLGVSVVGDWEWHEAWGRWALLVHLSPGCDASPSVPAETAWFILAESAYPRGAITFFPAVAGGLAVTFPHQHYNAAADDAPWRRGDICLEDFLAAIGRAGLGAEPEGADTRLRWRAERAIEWLVAAAAGALLRPGDPFELPDFPKAVPDVIVAFRESPKDLARWRTSARWGTVDLLRHPSIPRALVVQRFVDGNGRRLPEPEWGTALAASGGVLQRGIWLRLDRLPVFSPWQAPATWGELRRLASHQGLDLDKILRRVMRSLAEGESHVALIGFPIPSTVDGPNVRMHWQAMLLPDLVADRRTAFAADRPLAWLLSENWHASDIATRGRFAEMVVSQHVVIIGTGALGSSLAELLVRGGVTRLTLFDGDTLQAGNLVRHTLGLSDLLSSKASAVAARVSLANPSTHVDAVVDRFPPIDPGLLQLQTADVIIDTTGVDDVAAAMVDFPWGRPRLFVSLSLALGAHRIYLYMAQGQVFPNEHFRGLVDPLAIEDHEHFEGEPPWEAIGCWHPVFPARSDDVWLLVAAASKRVVAAIEQPPSTPELIVIEQVYDAGQFDGVQVRRL